MMPPMNISGRNTAESERHIDMHGEADFLGPIERRLGGVFPISMWRTMFSSITIASSTTKPTGERERHQRQVVDG